MRRGVAYPVCSLLFAALLLTGCRQPERSTRITPDDLDAMSVEMAESLRASDALAERGPSSDPWWVSMDRVQNLSSDVIPERELWMVMYQIRGSFPIQALWDDKQVRFVIPPERVEALRLDETGAGLQEFGSGRQVTHTLAATFLSSTRAPSLEARTDTYYCEFQVLELASGQIIWTDRFEYKRRAVGNLLD